MVSKKKKRKKKEIIRGVYARTNKKE